MDVLSRRTVKGYVQATKEQITDIQQLKEGDVIMVGFVEKYDFLPYLVFNIDGELFLTQIPALSRSGLGFGLSNEMMEHLIIYRATLDTSDKTYPFYMHLSLLFCVLALVSCVVLKGVMALLLALVLSIMGVLCLKASRTSLY